MQPYYLSLDTTPPRDYEPPEQDWRSMTLTELADAYRTDKGSLKHNYTQVYERYFFKLSIDPLEDAEPRPLTIREPLTLLEIGVACGASLKMWSRYFPHGKITGCDIRPECGYLCENYPNINIVIQDAARNPVHGSWDIIIDDGSHVALDIKETFRAHWPLLKSGGYYCIEDTGCTLPEKKYDRPRRFSGEREREEYDRFISNLLSTLDRGQEMEFVHFHKELIVIRKQT